jgi:hypothetical protein
MKRAKVLLCMVLSLLMLVDYTVFQPAPAYGKIDKKSALIGGAVGVAAGAGLVLAAPAIGGALAGAGGIAGSIVGGIAAIGGGVLGAVSAFAGAIGSAIGAVGGFIAGIFTSPLFIPALVIVGACVAGYFLYKKYKEKKAKSASDKEIFPDSEVISVTPGDYKMSSIIPAGDMEPISVKDSEIIPVSSKGTSVTVSNKQTVSSPVKVKVADTESEAEKADNSGKVTTANSDSLKSAEARYTAAYNKYINLVTNSGGADSNEVKAAFKEYQDAHLEYQNLKSLNGIK